LQLTIDNVSKRYGAGNWALRNFTLELDPGVLGLLGPNGAGKTTLMRIRLLFAADWHSFAAWLSGALFIPTRALALGVWSGSSKAFEAIYTVWWYIGPAHQIPGLDFVGTTPASSSPGIYALATIFLLAVIYWGRRTRLGYA